MSSETSNSGILTYSCLVRKQKGMRGPRAMICFCSYLPNCPLIQSLLIPFPRKRRGSRLFQKMGIVVLNGVLRSVFSENCWTKPCKLLAAGCEMQSLPPPPCSEKWLCILRNWKHATWGSFPESLGRFLVLMLLLLVTERWTQLAKNWEVGGSL